MNKVLAFFANIRLLFSGPKDLKASAAKALNVLNNAKTDISDAEARLNATRAAAVTETQTALATLRSDADAAAAVEAETELARIAQLDSFDNLTTSQVDALKKKLAELEARRTHDRVCLADELETERLEFAAEAEVASTTETELALAIAELEVGAHAQAAISTPEGQ